MMRILVLMHRIPYPLKDGGAWASYDLLKQLNTYVGQVDILSYNTTKHYVKEEIIKDQFSFLNSIHVVRLDNRITPLGALRNLFTNRSYHISRFESQDWLDRLTDILNTHYDIIILDHVFLKYSIPLIRSKSSAKIFVRIHNLEYKIWEGLAKNSSLLKKAYLTIQANRLKKEELQAYSEIRNLLFINGKEQRVLEQEGDPHLLKPYYLPFTLNNRYEYNRYKKDSIFHIASMDWLPNQEALEWFIHNVLPIIKNDNIKLHIAGKGLDKGKYNYPLIINHGEVDDSISFMKENGILIVPLLSGAGVRIKILQALALGIPVVTTSIGVFGIDVEHKKHVYIADSAEEFANAIDELSKGDSAIGKHAQEFFESNYQSEKVYQDFKKYLLDEQA